MWTTAVYCGNLFILLLLLSKYLTFSVFLELTDILVETFFPMVG